VRKRLAIAGHSEEGLSLIPLFEANPDIEVCAILSADRDAALATLQQLEPGQAARFEDRITDDVDAVLRTQGLVAIVDADPGRPLQERLAEATERGIQITTPLIAKLLYAFGPVDASRKPDLLKTLSEILESYSLTIDRRGLVERILQIAVGATGADRGSVMLWDEASEVLRVEVAVGIERELLPKIHIRPGEGIAGRAFQERRAILLRGKADPREFAIAREREDVASAIAAPLVYNGRCLGVLNVSHARDRNALGSEQLEFVEELARLDARILARSQEYHQLVQESGRLRMEAEVRRLLSGGEPLEDRLSGVCRWIASELGDGICQIYLRDAHGEMLLLQATSTRRDPLAQPTRLRSGEGVLGWVAQSGEPALVQSLVGGAELCFAALPLSAREGLSGVLWFEAAFREGAPEALALRLRTASAALAEELGSALRELRIEQRATKMGAIAEVAARMSATEELGELYRTITTSAAMVLESEHAILRLQDPASGRFQIRSYFGSADTDAQGPLFSLEKELAVEATQAREPLRARDLDQRPELARYQTGVVCAVVQPLVREGEVMGTLSVLGRTTAGPLGAESFGDEDVELLARFSEHGQRALIHVQDRERVRHSQRFDELTGLPNAGQLRQRLEEEVARSAGRGRPLAVLRVRVAGLASLIASQSRAEGDALVLSLAQELRAHLRDFDVLARTAPDTFEIVVPEPDEDVSGMLGPLARRVQDALRRDIGEEQRAQLELEFGYALYPDEGASAATLLEKARGARIRSV
jgi:GGDEF domain-containing protein